MSRYPNPILYKVVQHGPKVGAIFHRLSYPSSFLFIYKKKFCFLKNNNK